MGLSKKTIQLFKDGDKIAIGIVFEEYKKLLYFIISTYVSNPDDCNDLLSESFIKAIANKDSLKSTHEIKSFLSSIAKNEALQFLRKSKEIVSDSLDDIYGINDKGNLSLDYLCPLLSDKETIVVYYRAVFSYTWKEIREETGIPESTSKLIYKNAKEKLRKEYHL